MKRCGAHNRARGWLDPSDPSDPSDRGRKIFVQKDWTLACADWRSGPRGPRSKFRHTAAGNVQTIAVPHCSRHRPDQLRARVTIQTEPRLGYSRVLSATDSAPSHRSLRCDSSMAASPDGRRSHVNATPCMTVLFTTAGALTTTSAATAMQCADTTLPVPTCRGAAPGQPAAPVPIAAPSVASGDRHPQYMGARKSVDSCSNGSGLRKPPRARERPCAPAS